ncbi:hypothetical protein GCM10009619_07090 [Williamsia maris]
MCSQRQVTSPQDSAHSTIGFRTVGGSRPTTIRVSDAGGAEAPHRVCAVHETDSPHADSTLDARFHTVSKANAQAPSTTNRKLSTRADCVETVVECAHSGT